jgi:phosphoglycerol transferase MdoB-like AlkP superfamily enzyme
MMGKFLTLFIFLQQVNVEDKLKDAPDNNYAIGVFIGEMLPFIILIALAYFFFYWAKKKRK